MVVRGEAGIGKTCLLDAIAASAADFDVVRLVGIESEMRLGFAALHQLLTPFLDDIDALPPPQARALKAAFGMSDDNTPDQFLVGLAALDTPDRGRDPTPTLDRRRRHAMVGSRQRGRTRVRRPPALRRPYLRVGVDAGLDRAPPSVRRVAVDHARPALGSSIDRGLGRGCRGTTRRPGPRAPAGRRAWESARAGRVRSGVVTRSSGRRRAAPGTIRRRPQTRIPLPPPGRRPSTRNPATPPRRGRRAIR